MENPQKGINYIKDAIHKTVSNRKLSNPFLQEIENEVKYPMVLTVREKLLIIYILMILARWR